MSSRFEPGKMDKMKQKSLIIFVTLTALIFTNFAFAEEIILTAELSGNKFNPGDVLGISGNLTGVFAPVNITIDILNGTDLALINSFNVSTIDDPEENYTANYDLTDAEIGEYLVNVTYGDYYVELEFEVEAEEENDEDTPDDIETGDSEVCDDLSYAIERAEIYLDRVRSMLDEFADEYNETHYPDIYEKLMELNTTLDLAEEYLENASIALDEGDCNAAARNHAAARNLMGRVKGLLNSIIKEHKVQMTEKFMEQFERRINSTQVKVNQLSARFGAQNTESVAAKLGNAWGRIKKLQGTVNISNVDEVLKSLKNNTKQFDEELEDLGDDEAITIIKNMNWYEAKIKVLEKTQERLQRKGEKSDEFTAQLDNMKQLNAQLKTQLNNPELNDQDLDEIGKALDEAKNTLKGLKSSSKTNNGKISSTNGKANGKSK